MIEKWQKVRVIDTSEYFHEQAIAEVIEVTELLRQKMLKIRFDSGHELEVDSRQVSVVNAPPINELNSRESLELDFSQIKVIDEVDFREFEVINGD